MFGMLLVYNDYFENNKQQYLLSSGDYMILDLLCFIRTNGIFPTNWM